MTTMSAYVEELKQRVLEAEARADEAESLVQAFFTGDVPEGGTLQHALLAQWGRQRLKEKRANKLAVLLTAKRPE